jgi:hypothetical protein
MDEEKRRLQSTREEIGDSSGGKRIDLESGKVTIRRDSGDESDDTAAQDSPAPRADAEESPARARARARRQAGRKQQ